VEWFLPHLHYLNPMSCPPYPGHLILPQQVFSLTQ
jgi:hypothetical protein